MITWQHLEQFVKSAIYVLKRRRREQAAFAIAAFCFSGGLVLGGGKLVPDFKDSSKWIVGLHVALYAIGAIAFVYAAIRVWRLVNPIPPPPAKDRPSAIKGPTAFTEADGELFRRLGRENELQKLLGLVLDDQVLMVVVRGASGAGKTSLLRAGLKHILGDRVIFHYWEAVPSEPDKGLLRAIHERWPEGTTKPASLDELINPIDSLGRQSHVVVLDQFEQLRGNKKIFQLLRRTVRESKPPHRITWVIAFRREFSADWLDFISPEQERGVRVPQDISLRLFTAEQAREIIGQLVNESNLKDSIEQSVINNLVEAATVEGEVSPVDIGIGLLVLAELHERQSGKTITIRDYQFAGGDEGLLTQYISRCLELFPKESQEGILKAMLALRDPEENRQRLAAGLTNVELAAEAGADARVLKLQLNRLADRDIRLLETDTPANGSEMRYRLPHERVVPALYRLTGKLLAEVDQAKLRFQNAFQAWKTNDKRSRYVLKGKELRLVERYETQIPWGTEEQEKKNFLYHSKRHRRFVQAITVAGVLALTGVVWFSILQYRRMENERYLSESGYPRELFKFQHQLKKLDLTLPLDLERFTWMSSHSLEELSLKASSLSKSVAGLSSLSNCDSLKKLKIDLHGSQVSDLTPVHKLTQLTLDLGEVKSVKSVEINLNVLDPGLTTLSLNRWDFDNLSTLQPLEKFSDLMQLRLDLGFSKVSDLKPLERLSKLSQLDLNLNDSEVSDLKPLSELSNLTELSLDLRDSRVSKLDPLAELSKLTELRLNLSDSQVSNLEALASSNLTDLTIGLGGSQVTNLGPLAALTNLTELDLSMEKPQSFPVGDSRASGQVSDLEPLGKLSNLTHLTLDLSDSKVSNLEPLGKLNKLTALRLTLGETQVINLEPLANLGTLKELTLYLGRTEVRSLEPLARLSNLTYLNLDLGMSDVRDLGPLAKLSNLKELRLDGSDSYVRNLEPLASLSNVTDLYLDLSNARNLSTLDPLSKLSKLTQLTLDITSANHVNNLVPLASLSNLTELTISLSGSSVYDLEPLANMNSLRTLSIESARTVQRQSLKKIPANLVELKF